ncbi:MAG: hypothetical protein LAO79_02115 [Acidobacteriia bacterium]|nr:hypothetical protein [Terriglobia bacterium]
MRIAMAALWAMAAAQGVVLDRVAVTVGKQVIAQSDVLRDVRVSAFLDQRPLDLSRDQKRKAADRLVDQLLILQEAAFSRVVLDEKEDAQKALQQIKLSAFADDAEYRAALAKYGITEQDVLNHLAAGLRAMRFTDLRFRPEVQLTDEDLHEYYDRLVIEWRKKDPEKVPTFEASRDQVEKLLTDERTTQALDRWLGMQRSETQILYREQAFQ